MVEVSGRLMSRILVENGITPEGSAVAGARYDPFRDMVEFAVDNPAFGEAVEGAVLPGLEGSDDRVATGEAVEE